MTKHLKQYISTIQTNDEKVKSQFKFINLYHKNDLEKRSETKIFRKELELNLGKVNFFKSNLTR